MSGWQEGRRTVDDDTQTIGSMQGAAAALLASPYAGTGEGRAGRKAYVVRYDGAMKQMD